MQVKITESKMTMWQYTDSLTNLRYSCGLIVVSQDQGAPGGSRLEYETCVRAIIVLNHEKKMLGNGRKDMRP